MNVVSYLASILIPWTAKTVLYHFGFRWRHIHATLQTKLIVAGAPMIVRGVLPFELPHFLMFVLSVAVALYFCKQFTDGKLYPDLVVVVAAAELIAAIFLDELLLPLLF